MKTLFIALVLALLVGCAVVPAGHMHSGNYFVRPPNTPPPHVYHVPQYPVYGDRRFIGGNGYHR